MSCAACQAHVEKAVNKVEGVTSCSVSLLTNSMTVEGTASPSAIIKAVEAAGYGASASTPNNKATNKASELENKEAPILKNRLIFSVIFLLMLMYISMGVMMWGFPFPEILKHNMMAHGIIEMFLAGIIMVINQKFFISGTKAAIHLAPNMDTLVAMGSGVSFLYSVYVLIKMTVTGDMTDDLYFESAAMIVTLITVGKLLESISKGRTTNALKSLMELAPPVATVIRDGSEITVPVEEVSVGDIFAVKPGDKIPVDGVVIEGSSAVNEAALTGESVPVDKTEGDKVSAATVNQSGYLKCKATRVGEDTTLSQIIKLVSESSATKAPIARAADKISGIFVPAVLVIALSVTVIWLITGASVSTALTRGIAVLVVSCPCALGLATPVAIMAGNGVGARNGLLFKTSEALELTGKLQIVALDKTGTITKGEPSVTDVISEAKNKKLIALASSLEQKSEHPLAKAIVAYAEEHNIESKDCSDFLALPGNGLTGIIDNQRVYGGNRSYVSSKTTIPDEALRAAEKLSDEGKTPLFFGTDSEFCGIIAVADTIKDESSKAIDQLHNMGIKTVMLTGDNERTAASIANKSGVGKVISNVLPDGKDKVIKKLMEYGKVAMVGDGINDAPALTSSDIGIAIGAGTDVAIDAADAVIVKSRLTDVPAAIRLSRRTVTIIHENLFWAFIYNILLIPIAAGALSGFGINMTPVFGAAAMSISSFTVCMNALRINLYDPTSPKRDRLIRKPAELPQEITGGNITMATKTINIEGMMCGHCEKTVKNALLDIEGVASAEVSHEKGTAVVELNGDVSDDQLKKAVEDKDYKVTGIN